MYEWPVTRPRPQRHECAGGRSAPPGIGIGPGSIGTIGPLRRISAVRRWV